MKRGVRYGTGDGELLVRVRAAGINGVDLAERAGRSRAPPGLRGHPGARVSRRGGRAGPGRSGLRRGRSRDGAARWRRPRRAGHRARAACAACAGRALRRRGRRVHGGVRDRARCVFTQAGLTAGERLLVTGAAGGVGIAGVQLGLAAGASVTALAGHSTNRLEALGADTNVAGAYNVILELVGGDYVADDLGRLAVGGRIVVIGMGAGSRVTLELGLLMRRRGRIELVPARPPARGEGARRPARRAPCRAARRARQRRRAGRADVSARRGAGGL